MTQTILGFNMQLTNLAKTQQRSIVLYPESVPLYKIYNQFIHPHLKPHQINLEISIALSKPLLCIKVKKLLFLVHGFPLFNFLKSLDTSSEILIREFFLIEINDDLYRFELAFYELIEMISRYHKVLDLEKIYSNLNELLNPNICQRFFGKDELTVAEFCRLINVPQRTYYNNVRSNR